jgi:hypothetical protein
MRGGLERDFSRVRPVEAHALNLVKPGRLAMEIP